MYNINCTFISHFLYDLCTFFCTHLTCYYTCKSLCILRISLNNLITFVAHFRHIPYASPEHPYHISFTSLAHSWHILCTFLTHFATFFACTFFAHSSWTRWKMSVIDMLRIFKKQKSKEKVETLSEKFSLCHRSFILF